MLEMPSLKEVKLDTVAESKEFKIKMSDNLIDRHEEKKLAFSEQKTKKRIQLSKDKIKLTSKY